MKGFVPTPRHLVDAMVSKLFRTRPPLASEAVLDPGCGTGAFIEGVLRWCAAQRSPIPRIVGIDSDPVLLNAAKRALVDAPRVTLICDDFLTPWRERFDYIVGNPPYVPITGLSVGERAAYRRSFRSASGRFDLYLLFFEQAMRLLNPNGRLVFVTPEKFLYVQTAASLRRELAMLSVEEIELVDESAFGELVTYPTITTVSNRLPTGRTQVRLRDSTVRTVSLNASGGSWQPLINGLSSDASGPTLADSFVRISCGVATGADDVYVMASADLPRLLRKFAYPTLSGRSIVPGQQIKTTHSMLTPYDKGGVLLAESRLGALGTYLREPTRRRRLLERTCAKRKPWYAFHETPPLSDILTPKILCKDIGARPWFVVDRTGVVVPRHSVYYLVPKDAASIHNLSEYLNSDAACSWLMSHCQRAANGFVRLQSHVLKRLPMPGGPRRAYLEPALTDFATTSSSVRP